MFLRKFGRKINVSHKIILKELIDNPGSYIKTSFDEKKFYSSHRDNRCESFKYIYKEKKHHIPPYVFERLHPYLEVFYRDYSVLKFRLKSDLNLEKIL